MIRCGIAEDAERAFLCGWWRRGVPDPAGDGCRKKGLGACAPGPFAWDRRRWGLWPGFWAWCLWRVVQLWPGIGCGASGMGRGLAFGGAGRRLWLPALGPGAVDLWPGLLAVGEGPG